MQINAFVVGDFETNCYLVSCKATRMAMIIDPGFDNHVEAEKIFKTIQENRLRLKFIVNTHGHPDHVCGNGIVKETYNVPILIHESDAFLLEDSAGKEVSKMLGIRSFSPAADRLLRDGDKIEVGEVTLRVIHTPGHSSGSISLLGEKAVFTGDTLFARSKGRTDFPDSSEKDMVCSLKKLADLPNDLIAYPGHGLTTSIGEEKRSNPFLRFT
jgi:glyoxylase-like metal-dependent hydrolase (beta-lactamase superfamily II)